MDQALYELYRKNGISHVLAISGLHVSILGLGLWKALRRCGFGFAAAGGAAGAFLFCYGLMTGFGPSVVRAAAMCGLSFLAAFLGRTYELMSALCIPAGAFVAPALSPDPGVLPAFLSCSRSRGLSRRLPHPAL